MCTQSHRPRREDKLTHQALSTRHRHTQPQAGGGRSDKITDTQPLRDNFRHSGNPTSALTNPRRRPALHAQGSGRSPQAHAHRNTQRRLTTQTSLDHRHTRHYMPSSHTHSHRVTITKSHSGKDARSPAARTTPATGEPRRSPAGSGSVPRARAQSTLGVVVQRAARGRYVPVAPGLRPPSDQLPLSEK